MYGIYTHFDHRTFRSVSVIDPAVVKPFDVMLKEVKTREVERTY